MYSDFIVQEISENKELAYLDPESAKEKIQQELAVFDEEKSKKDAIIDDYKNFEISESGKKTMAELFTDEEMKGIHRLLDEIAVSENLAKEVVAEVTCPRDKVKRKAVHNFVREEIPFLDSRTQQ